MQKTKRDSKFELLRIICMILIVAHHLVCYGGYDYTSNIPFMNLALLRTFVVGGKLGVNIFVLIGAYFLVDKDFKLSKTIKLILQVFFYSMLFYLTFTLFGGYNFSVQEFFANFFSVTVGKYWFITAYLIMYCLSPFINKLIKQLSQKEHKILIIFLLFIQCIVGIVYRNYLSNVGWFITLYLIAAYLKMYPNDDSKKITSIKINLLIFIVSFSATILFNVFLNVSFYSQTHLVNVASSISLFNVFRNLKPFHSKFINTVSSTTFGVYLIHENGFMRNFIWQQTFKCGEMVYSNYFIPYAFGIVLLIFIACSIIELCRIYLIEKPLIKCYEKFNLKKQEKLKEITSKIDNNENSKIENNTQNIEQNKNDENKEK